MKLNIKKLIAANALLLMTLQVLPTEKLPLKENLENQVEKEIQQVAYVEVTDRSLEEHREIIEEIIEEEKVEVTKYSQACVDLVKKYEGFRSQAYKINGEQWYTIGYGTHNAKIKSTDIISQEEAERLLTAELDGTCNYILKYFDGYLELNQNELDALTSMMYNLGCGWLNTLTANKTRTKKEIEEHITAYTSGGMKGLVKRRNEELKMFKGEI